VAGELSDRLDAECGCPGDERGDKGAMHPARLFHQIPHDTSSKLIDTQASATQAWLVASSWLAGKRELTSDPEG
jgi:hypothetical protein